MRETVRFARIAVIAALYAALTVAIAPLSYGAVQFRFAEILVLLCFYRKDYCYALILGCFIANWFSPMGYIDVIFGTCSTVFSVVTMRYIKNFYIAAFMPTVSMIIVAAELWLFAKEPFWISLGTTALGEFVVVSIAGVVIFKILEKNKVFMQLIGSDKNKIDLIKAIHLDKKALLPPEIQNDAELLNNN